MWKLITMTKIMIIITIITTTMIVIGTVVIILIDKRAYEKISEPGEKGSHDASEIWKVLEWCQRTE